MRVNNLGFFGIGLGLFLGSASAYADTIYLDSASWNAAVSGSAVTTVTIPDPAPSQFVLIGSGNASVTYSGVNFSASSALGSGSLFDISHLFSGNPAVLSDQGGGGEDDILITFPNPVVAFDLNYGTAQGFAVYFTLSNGDTVGCDPNNLPISPGCNFGATNYATPYFAGVTDTPFTSVLVTSADTQLDINNVSFVGATPEPAPLALVSFGLLCFGLRFGLLGYARRRKQRA